MLCVVENTNFSVVVVLSNHVLAMSATTVPQQHRPLRMHRCREIEAEITSCPCLSGRRQCRVMYHTRWRRCTIRDEQQTSPITSY